MKSYKDEWAFLIDNDKQTAARHRKPVWVYLEKAGGDRGVGRGSRQTDGCGCIDVLSAKSTLIPLA